MSSLIREVRIATVDSVGLEQEIIRVSPQAYGQTQP